MNGSTIAAAESSSHIKLSTEYSVRYRATGVSALAMAALISGPSLVLTEISMGVMAIFFHGARITMRTASGSNHQLNSRRPSTPLIPPLSAYMPLPIRTSSFASVATCGSRLRQGDVRKRASGPHYYFPGILMHHANNEVGGGFVEWLGVWRTLDQRRDYIRLVIPGPECRRRARRPIGKIAPAALIAELAIESFPAFAFFFGVKQRKLSALDNRNVGAPSNFQQPERALGFLFHPLVAADGSDAQDVESIRLEKDQNRLHVGRSRPTRILIHDHFNLLTVQVIRRRHQH